MRLDSGVLSAPDRSFYRAQSPLRFPDPESGLLLAQFLRIVRERVAVARRHVAGARAAHAVVRFGLAAEQQFQLIQLVHSLAADARRQFSILRRPLGGIQTLGTIDQILIFLRQLRIARDCRPQLGQLPHDLVVSGLGLRRSSDFRSVALGSRPAVPDVQRTAGHGPLPADVINVVPARAISADLAAPLRVATAALAIACLLALALALSLSLALALSLLTLASLAVASLLALALALALLSLTLTLLALTLLALLPLLALSLLAASLLLALTLTLLPLLALSLLALLATRLLSAALSTLLLPLLAARAGLLPALQRLHLRAHGLALVDRGLSRLALFGALTAGRRSLLRVLQIVAQLVDGLRHGSLSHHRVLAQTAPNVAFERAHTAFDISLLGVTGGIAKLFRDFRLGAGHRACRTLDVLLEL